MNLPHYLTEEALAHFIDSALKEDLGTGDHSSLGAIQPQTKSKARIIIKAEGVLAGISIAKKIFHTIDSNLKVSNYFNDGEGVKSGDTVIKVSGRAISILAAERVVLNCLQRMSGIATKTSRLVKLISHTSARLLDTRKTTPNARIMEKWAVAIGGGHNHRFGLSDMVMLKDNHHDFAGGISNSISATRAYLIKNKLNLRIEVETRNLEEVREAMKTGRVDVIMLDNFDLPQMAEAVALIGDHCHTEASGGINEDNIKAIAETGVDFISVGSLTHSYQSMDMSLNAIKTN